MGNTPNIQSRSEGRNRGGNSQGLEEPKKIKISEDMKFLEKQNDCSGEEETKAGIRNSSKSHITTTKVDRFREAGQEEVDPRRCCSGDLGSK